MAKDDQDFASMDEEQRKNIAKSQGAENNPANFTNDTERASKAGKKGEQSNNN